MELSALAPGSCLVSGNIDERLDGSVYQAFLKVQAASGVTRVRLDLSGVLQVNSVGLERWARACLASKVPVLFANVPSRLIDQFNVWPDFMTSQDVLVESFDALFYIPKTDDILARKLTVGTDIPLQASYEHFQLPGLADGTDCEPDFEPEAYFSFLTYIYQRLHNT